MEKDEYQVTITETVRERRRHKVKAKLPFEAIDVAARLWLDEGDEGEVLEQSVKERSYVAVDWAGNAVLSMDECELSDARSIGFTVFRVYSEYHDAENYEGIELKIQGNVATEVLAVFCGTGCDRSDDDRWMQEMFERAAQAYGRQLTWVTL